MKAYTMSKLEMELLPMRMNPTRKYFFESMGQVHEYVVHFVHMYG
jgi:hypothetical protein